MKLKDYLPLKVVAHDLGVSRVTLWRAARSGIPGFPTPTVIRRLVYWKFSEIGRLEDALFRYQGRVSFERQRDAQRKVDQLRRSAAPRCKRLPRSSSSSLPQPDLFDRRA